MAKYYVLDENTGETVDEADTLPVAITRAENWLKEENGKELVVAKAHTRVRMSFEKEEV